MENLPVLVALTGALALLSSPAHAAPPMPRVDARSSDDVVRVQEFVRLCEAVKQATSDAIFDPAAGIDELDEVSEALGEHRLELAKNEACHTAWREARIEAARARLRLGLRRAASKVLDELIRSMAGQATAVAPYGDEVLQLYNQRLIDLSHDGRIEVNCPDGCDVIVETVSTQTTVTGLPIGEYRVHVEPRAGNSPPEDTIVELSNPGDIETIDYPRPRPPYEIEIEALNAKLDELDAETSSQADMIENQARIIAEFDRETERARKRRKLQVASNTSFVMGSYAALIGGSALLLHAGTHHIRDTVGADATLRGIHNSAMPVAVAAGSIAVTFIITGIAIRIHSKRKFPELKTVAFRPDGIHF